MREELEKLWPFGYSSRITPAHAGRIGLSGCASSLCWDHPRACGKNLKAIGASEIEMGSPPRMREEY